MIGSATRRSSELVMFRSIARRWLLVRLSFLSPSWWRMCYPLLNLLQPDRGPVFQFHPQREPTRGEHFLDLVERLAAQVRRLQQLRLRALDQVADVIDV